MSEYSTDELVKRTMRHWAWWWEGTKDATGISRPEHGFQYRDAIIARLRAADKLCEAARKSVDNCPCNFGGLDEEGRPFGKQPCDECDPLRKAIADYEGKP